MRTLHLESPRWTRLRAVAWTCLALTAACDDDDPVAPTPCPTQPYRLLEDPASDDRVSHGSAVSVTTLCQNNCPASEDAVIERTTCRFLSIDAAVLGAELGDSGVRLNPIDHRVRAEGCGFTQIHTPRSLGGSYYTFTLDGGGLVGAGRYDDVAVKIPGSSCEDSTYVAGVITPPCPDASVLYCDRKR